MKRTKLAAVLKILLHEKNLSESELARRTGVGQPVIHRMASGETDNPKIDTLRPIAKFFSLSLDQLIGDQPLPSFIEVQSSHRINHIPLLSLTEATLWPAQKSKISTLDHTFTDAEVGQLAFAIKLLDDHSLPLFPAGTLLVIDPECCSGNRDFVLLHFAGQKGAVLKQLLIDGEDFYLKPLNPEFKTIAMSRKDKILGTMVQAKIDFRFEQR